MAHSYQEASTDRLEQEIEIAGTLLKAEGLEVVANPHINHLTLDQSYGVEKCNPSIRCTEQGIDEQNIIPSPELAPWFKKKTGPTPEPDRKVDEVLSLGTQWSSDRHNTTPSPELAPWFRKKTGPTPEPDRKGDDVLSRCTQWSSDGHHSISSPELTPWFRKGTGPTPEHDRKVHDIHTTNRLPLCTIPSPDLAPWFRKKEGSTLEHGRKGDDVLPLCTQRSCHGNNTIPSPDLAPWFRKKPGLTPEPGRKGDEVLPLCTIRSPDLAPWFRKKTGLTLEPGRKGDEVLPLCTIPSPDLAPWFIKKRGHTLKHDRNGDDVPTTKGFSLCSQVRSTKCYPVHQMSRAVTVCTTAHTWDTPPCYKNNKEKEYNSGVKEPPKKSNFLKEFEPKSCKANPIHLLKNLPFCSIQKSYHHNHVSYKSLAPQNRKRRQRPYSISSSSSDFSDTECLRQRPRKQAHQTRRSVVLTDKIDLIPTHLSRQEQIRNSIISTLFPYRKSSDSSDELVDICTTNPAPRRPWRSNSANPKNKRAVYEPSAPQRCRQVICSKEMALTVGIVTCAVILAVAFIASFARPETPTCYTTTQAPVSITPEEANYTTPEPISHNGKRFPWKHIRLPRTIQPLTYDLFLHPNLTTTLVIGNVTILSQALSSTDFIVLHMDSMNITEITVHSHFNNEVIGTRDVLFYPLNSLMYIKLDRALQKDELFDLRIYFRYHMHQILTGFYLSSYTAEDGSTRYLGTTHFEASGARKAFPCFDEPALKANFSLSMVREERHVTLFNMPLRSTSAYMHGLTLDSFDTSVKMSTYLVAFVVSDFVNQTKYSASGIQVRVFSNKESIHLTSYALDTAVTVIDYYEKFYGLPYPLPKMDLVAIPDFDAGAMENWGLITYRTSSILYDANGSPISRRLRVAQTIAHELAHQWFGNYVTMAWWNDLWLNEGFATFMSYIGINVVDSDYQIFELFIVTILQVGLEADSLVSSHPIQVRVDKPADIDAIFDLISYRKGGAIIRMMRHFVGTAAFEKRLNNYLDKFAYKNARTDDLWEAMSGSPSDADYLDVKTIMDTWTKQMGYPVVSVEIRGEQVTVKQERFIISPLANNSSVPASPFDYKWYIPMTYVTSTEPTNPQMVWLNMSSATFTVPKGTSWVKANYQSVGFYRVNYEEPTWKALISELTTNHKVFHPEDRAMLIDDLCNMARAGKVDYTLCLEVTEYLVQEDEFAPFKLGIKNLLYMDKFMVTLPTYEWYKNYILKLLSNQLKILGWKTDGTPLKRSLRSTVLRIAIQMGNRAIVNRGQEIFQEWRYNNRSIHPDLMDSVLLASMADGSSENWNYLWQTYTETSNPILKKSLLKALGMTPNVNDLNRYLRFSLQRDFIRSQDLVSVFRSITSSLTGQLLAWRHLKLNWKTLQERLQGSTFTFSGIIRTIISEFVTGMDCQEVIEFFEGKELGTAKRTVDNAIEVIRMNKEWMDRNHVHVSKWFREHGQ